MMATLRNDFHNTTASVRFEPGKALTQRQIQRVRTQLCGMADCCCAGVLGTRGPQDVDITYSDCEDGIVLHARED